MCRGVGGGHACAQGGWGACPLRQQHLQQYLAGVPRSSPPPPPHPCSLTPPSPQVLENDFFLTATREQFMEAARQLLFETYCRIHQAILLPSLSQQLGMDEEATEKWIVNLIRWVGEGDSGWATVGGGGRGGGGGWGGGAGGRGGRSPVSRAPSLPAPPAQMRPPHPHPPHTRAGMRA